MKKASPPSLQRLLLAVLIAFVAIDAAIGYATKTTTFLADAVDIQTPATLYAKLDYFRELRGRRIAFVGDSVVYGRRMEEAGDANWRQHTIPAHVGQILHERFPQQPISIMNLAMNGGLPTDIEQVVRLLSPLKPDCIVADISLRAFSTDFSQESNRYSRPWLSTMVIDSSFNLHDDDTRRAWTSRTETTLQDFALSHWRLYRMRDFVQWRVFDGEPSGVIRRLRDRLDRQLGRPPAEADPLDDILLTIKAKNRYGAVTLTDDNPQIAALKRTLDGLASNAQCAVFFYATEEKGQLAELMDAQHYEKLQDALTAIFLPYQNRGIMFLPPLPDIGKQYYLDYGHLNDAGNAIVARNIVENGLSQSIPQLRREP
ncbi:hypothetical protein AAFG13_38710 [Bradyrhizobium sp. B124]|uniref:hypothetical protein n=1 Tax=Bradyrhizobium sp. B124 TaxID=3140245 RepID=UPI003183FC50